MKIYSMRQFKRLFCSVIAIIAFSMLSIGVWSAEGLPQFSAAREQLTLPLAVADGMQHLLTTLFL